MKCQFIHFISILVGFLLGFLKKNKEVCKRKEERRRKKRRKEIIGVRKKVRKRKKGRRKEKANYTSRILRFDKAQISHGAEKSCFTHLYAA